MLRLPAPHRPSCYSEPPRNPLMRKLYLCELRVVRFGVRGARTAPCHTHTTTLKPVTSLPISWDARLKVNFCSRDIHESCSVHQSPHVSPCAQTQQQQHKHRKRAPHLPTRCIGFPIPKPPKSPQPLCSSRAQAYMCTRRMNRQSSMHFAANTR